MGKGARGLGALRIAAIVLAALTATATSAQNDPPAGAAEAAAAQAATKKKAAEAPADAKKEEQDKRAIATLFQGTFRSDTLSGGAENEFRVPQPANRLTDVTVTLEWEENPYKQNEFICPSAEKPEPYGASTKRADPKKPTETVFGISIPVPPCLWPPTQYATVTIKAKVEKDSKPQSVVLLETSRLPVTVLWLPLLVTFIVLAAIYPGSAAARWYISKRQYNRRAVMNAPNIGEEPKFWTALNPVELTKNAWGRASIAKLQIYAFSFIIFGLLLFYVLRTGLLANMSQDILYLMGISAVGSAGAKIAFTARRRLNMENWVWLRRRGWLPADRDVQPHAKWSELFIDNATKEFDPYRFQMAVFSLVVAVALITTSATGLEAFKVPPEMLGLLGISQVVFIGGQAMENGGFADLDKKLTEIRNIETSYREAKTKAPADATPQSSTDAVAQKEAKAKLDGERAKFKAAVAQAKEMFIAVYGDQIGLPLPAPLANAENIEPEVHA